METIRVQEIDKAVEEHRCPGRYMCTVATTCYDAHKRERICLNCWYSHMEEHNIKIVYEE